ncbi:cytochrome b [Aliikangiella sp. IMCC44653]
MMLKNTSEKYGLIAKLLHWVVALSVLAMFSVGIWMVELDYYSNWYKVAPDYHKSSGILLAIILVVRVTWRLTSPKVLPLEQHTKLEKLAAHCVHLLLYVLLFAIFCTGYLISTEDNRAIDVFNWFSVPSMGQLFDNQADIAGDIHRWLAYILIGLVVVHIGGALKHHFIDKDNTLKRML